MFGAGLEAPGVSLTLILLFLTVPVIFYDLQRVVVINAALASHAKMLRVQVRSSHVLPSFTRGVYAFSVV